MDLLIRYDTEADAMFVSFREATGDRGARILDHRRFLHEDDGGVFEVEFLDVSKGIDFSGIPHAGAIRTALSALRPKD